MVAKNFEDKNLEDMTIEEIYELEEIYSPLVSSEFSEKKKKAEDRTINSNSPMTSDEIESMIQ